MIKAIIFDLDNTLYDAEPLTGLALTKAVEAMVKNGLRCSREKGLKKIKEIIKNNPSSDKFSELAKFFNSEIPEIVKAGKYAYYNAELQKLEPFPYVIETLEKLKKNFKLVLISFGSKVQQNKKINLLKIRDYFDYVFIDENNKEHLFSQIIEILKIAPEQILVVGDRIDNEIEIGNRLGMKTIRLKKGKYKALQPENMNQEPDFTIKNIKQVIDIIKENKPPKIVAIGGGTGLPTISEDLKKYTDDLTLIVTVTDSGRSSGILRKELNVLPPGDMRNCLIALSNSEKLMCDLFQYRFDNGSLNGHSFGNLFIAALTKLTGSCERAIEEASKILKLEGKVIPSTLDNVHICAELDDGKIIEEENNIIDRHNENVHLRSPIKKVFLKPEATANESALKEIQKAELIIICPGSLFTSIITNLLVKGLSEAINSSKAKKVYVCNIMTQQCQTTGYKASSHLKQIIKYLKGDIESFEKSQNSKLSKKDFDEISSENKFSDTFNFKEVEVFGNKNYSKSPIDYIILNSKKPSDSLLESYKKENAFLVENDINEIEKLGVRIILGDLLDDVNEKKLLWEKKNLLRHSPDKIGKVLIGLIENKKSIGLKPEVFFKPQIWKNRPKGRGIKPNLSNKDNLY